MEVLLSNRKESNKLWMGSVFLFLFPLNVVYMHTIKNYTSYHSVLLNSGMKGPLQSFFNSSSSGSLHGGSSPSDGPAGPPAPAQHLRLPAALVQ